MSQSLIKLHSFLFLFLASTAGAPYNVSLTLADTPLAAWSAAHVYDESPENDRVPANRRPSATALPQVPCSDFCSGAPFSASCPCAMIHRSRWSFALPWKACRLI